MDLIAVLLIHISSYFSKVRPLTQILGKTCQLSHLSPNQSEIPG